MNPGTAWNAAAPFFLSTKTSWVAVLSTDSNMTQWKDLQMIMTAHHHGSLLQI